jgi:hypothetical protein
MTQTPRRLTRSSSRSGSSVATCFPLPCTETLDFLRALLGSYDCTG